MKEYKIYRLNNFNNFPQDNIAIFYDFELAINFVEYMGSIGESFGVFDKKGNRLDIE